MINEFKLKPISPTDSSEVKMIKYNCEVRDFILNQLFKPQPINGQAKGKICNTKPRI